MGKFTDKVSILKSTDLRDCFSLLACLLRGTCVYMCVDGMER